MFIEILFKMLLFKGGVLIYVEHYINSFFFNINQLFYIAIENIS